MLMSEDTQKLSKTLQESKVEFSLYESYRAELERQMNLINSDLDKKESSIKAIESFTDKYIPIKIMH